MAQTATITFTSLQTPDHTFRSVQTVSAASRVELAEPIPDSAIGGGNEVDIEFHFPNSGSEVQAVMAGGDGPMTIKFYSGGTGGTLVGTMTDVGGGPLDTLPEGNGDFVWPSYSGDTAISTTSSLLDLDAGDVDTITVLRTDDGTNTDDMELRLTVYYDPTI